MDIKISRDHPDGSESLRPSPQSSLLAETERPLEEERREEGGPVLVSTSTYCSTERVRLAAKASATDLAPLSLMALLWRLWKQGRSALAAVP